MTEPDLNQLLFQLPNALEQKRKALEDQERELMIAKKAFEEEQAKFGPYSKNDVLELNVGGHKMTVFRRTLTLIEGSMLARQFSGKWDDSLEKDKEGNFFIDEPYQVFVALIDFLRMKYRESPAGPPVKAPKFGNDKVLLLDFYRLVDYYQMTHAVYPIGFSVKKGNPEALDVSGEEPFGFDATVTTKESLALEIDHNRPIKSFEITIIHAENLKIGFNIPEANPPITPVLFGPAPVFCVSSTCYLSTEFSSIFDRGVSHSIAVAIREGTIIRVEDYGIKWIIRNELEHDQYTYDSSENCKGSNPSFFTTSGLSAKWKINKIEYGWD